MIWSVEFISVCNISDTESLWNSLARPLITTVCICPAYRDGCRGSLWTEFPLKKFVEYFKEEIKDQVKGNPRNKL